MGVIREKHLVAIRTTCSPQQAVHVRALCVAYRLLQNFGEVRTGTELHQKYFMSFFFFLFFYFFSHSLKC